MTRGSTCEVTPAADAAASTVPGARARWAHATHVPRWRPTALATGAGAALVLIVIAVIAAFLVGGRLLTPGGSQARAKHSASQSGQSA